MKQGGNPEHPVRKIRKWDAGMYQGARARRAVHWWLVLLVLTALEVPGAALRAQPGRLQEGREVAEISVTGNRRVPESTVRYYIGTREGQPFSATRAREDFQALLRTGLFRDVRLQIETTADDRVRVVFEVVEAPLIEEIRFEGLHSLREDAILDHLREANAVLVPGSVLDENRLSRALRAVRVFLQLNGFPLGTVTLDRRESGGNVVALTFRVNEGLRVRVGTIEFEGNEVFGDGELLDALQLTRPTSLLARLRGRDRYIRERLIYDLQANVLPLYHSRGYIFARAQDPRVEIVEARRGWLPGFRRTGLEYRITVPIIEGEQYRYESFAVEGVDRLSDQGIEAEYRVRPGQWVDYVELRQANDRVKRVYAERGYLDMELIPELRPDFQKRTVQATVRIHEGGRYLVGKLNFQGNEKTRDKVLRREFVLEEGDLFSADLLDESILRLNQLGFIEPVTERDYELEKNPRDTQVDVLFRVRERDEHAINLNGGLGGISGSYIGVNYQSRNFRGLGQLIDLQLGTGTRTSNYSLSFTDPYWLDTRLSFTVVGFHRRLRFDTLGFLPGQGIADDRFALFTQRSTGMQATGSYPVSRRSRVGLAYSVDTNRIYDIREDFRSYATNQLVLLTTGGTVDEALTGIIRSQASPFWMYNSRNRLFGPTDGSYFIAQLPVAGGPLGGRIRTSHPYLEYQKFVPDPLWGKDRNSWAFRVQLEHVFAYGRLADGQPRPIPFLERIYLGGEQTLRGFDLRSVGPVALHRTPLLDPLGNPVLDPGSGLPVFQLQPVAVGGDVGAILTAEYRMPILGPLQLTPFADVGTSGVLRKSDLRHSAGPQTTSELIEETNLVWRVSTGLEIQFLLPVVNQPFRFILAYNPLRLDSRIAVDNQTFIFQEPKTNLKIAIGYSF
jgi:outer membrane protein insertion porin family